MFSTTNADDNENLFVLARHVASLSRDSSALLNVHNNKPDWYESGSSSTASPIDQFAMESDESVSSFVEKNGGSETRSRRERRVRDSADGGKIIVVVSAAETKPPAVSNDKFKRKVDDDVSRLNVISPYVRYLADESLEKLEYDKENVEEKGIPGDAKVSRDNRETDRIFPRQQQRTQRANRSAGHESAGIPTLLRIDDRFVAATASRVKPKIPRPANAFMLFANEWRRKLAAENPRESNKDISVRLGIFWKNMSRDLKEKYFALAREVDKEHKRKYPGMSLVI